MKVTYGSGGRGRSRGLYKPLGWRQDSVRHGLAAKGIKTKRITIDPLKLGRKERLTWQRDPKTGDIERVVKRVPTKAQRKYERLIRQGYEVDFSGDKLVLEKEVEPRRRYAAEMVATTEQRLDALNDFMQDKEPSVYSSPAIELYSQPTEVFGNRMAFDAYSLPPEQFDQTPYGVKPSQEQIVDLYALPTEQFDQRVPQGRFYAQKAPIVKNQTNAMVHGRVGDTKIVSEKIEPGYAFPISPKDVAKQLQKTPEDDRKGLKAVRFVQPKTETQKGAWAQLVRSKKEMLIFAQPEEELKDIEKVRKHMKQYVLPHEIGHHVALSRRNGGKGITDKKLATAEARADAYAFGFDVQDRDVKTFEKFHER